MLQGNPGCLLRGRLFAGSRTLAIGLAPPSDRNLKAAAVTGASLCHDPVFWCRLEVAQGILLKQRLVISGQLPGLYRLDLTMKEPGLHKISGGRIIRVNSLKVPRVIGKQGSMISLVKNKTGCEITIGQNGFVWIKGTPDGELLTERAIKEIEAKSHTEGLTAQIEKFLEENK